MPIAFLGDPKVKEMYVARAKAHQAADEIIQGAYWKNGKGCCVGCLAHNSGSAHETLERDAGLLRAITYLADRIHEGLPDGKYQLWPARFIDAPLVGADLSLVPARFIVWLLTEEVTRHFDAERLHACAEVCKRVAALHQRMIDGGTVSDAEWTDAATAARAEARAAAAEAAAWAAAWAAAAWAARAVAAEAWAAAAAAWAARAEAAAYERMADKLIELLEAAPVGETKMAA